MPAPSSTSEPRDDRHRCDNCGGPRAVFIEDNRNLCRHCATIHGPHRAALNVLLKSGVIYPKETP